MITEDMVVTWSGKLAKDIVMGDYLDAMPLGASELENIPAIVLGAPVFHMCQKITTLSGCEAYCSNNALVVVDDPARGGRAVVNCQSIGLYRIAVLVDGFVQYEPAIVQPHTQVPICQLLASDAAIAAGLTPNRRIFFTLPR